MIDPRLFGTSPDGFIPAMAIASFVKNAHKILIVGDFTKRDYNLLTALGKEVWVIDIVPLEGIEHFVQQSITDRTPFADHTFDAVIMAEVIEHLFQDYVALQEVHRILKDNGQLIITVPYLSNEQDKAEFHVRVHSHKTIRRLLAHCGFGIQQHFFRGLISRLPQKNRATKLFTFGTSKLLRTLLGHKKGLAAFQRLCFQSEKLLGSTKAMHWLQRRCTSFGGILTAIKTAPTDFMQIQQTSFTPPKTGHTARPH